MKVAENPRPSTLTPAAAARIGHGYESNLNYVLAEQHRERYLALYTTLQQVSAAHIEGIQAVTLITATGSVTVSLDRDSKDRAGTFYVELSEVLGENLQYHENKIVRYEEDSLKEEADEREGEGGRPELLGFCLPHRPMSNEEFAAMPPEARRAYDQDRAERLEAA